MYALARPLLFRLDAERAHDLAIGAMRLASGSPTLLRALRAACAVPDPRLQVRAFGLTFPNPVGLAAGMDKNAVAAPAFAALGFGAVEVGSVTAEAQAGNPRPRMFRLPHDEAIVNRMGFNNQGADMVARRLARLRERGGAGVPVGVNVGKSRSAPNDRARWDYERSLRAVWPHADYLVINVSSPNTPGLRELQDASALAGLLDAVAALRDELRPRPVLLKISPDLDATQLDAVVAAAERHRIDGLVATNTTTSRIGLAADPGAEGGLSGRPLAPRAVALLRDIRGRTELPVVSVGGIATAEDAIERLRLGASLVQLYTGLVFRGPGLVRAICRALVAACVREGAPDVAAWTAAAGGRHVPPEGVDAQD